MIVIIDIVIIITIITFIWDKIFKNGPIKICGRQPLKNLKEYGLLKQKDIVTGHNF